MDTRVLEYALAHVVSPVLPLAIQEIDRRIILTDDEKRRLAATSFSIGQTDRDPDPRQSGGAVPYATVRRLRTAPDPAYEVTVHVSTHVSIPPVGTDGAREKYLGQFATDLSFLVIMALLQLVRLLREDVPVVDSRDQGRLLTRPLGRLAFSIMMRLVHMEQLSPILADFSRH